jgi:NH3-dependent NAD+ synthetase
MVTYLDEYKSSYLLSCITANATDGLGISSTDLDQILPDWRDRHQSTKGGYEEVDDTFKRYFKQNLSEDELMELENNPVIQRYNSTNFKRNNPYKIKLKR